MQNKSSYIIPNWPAPDCIHAYSTTRLNGHSKPPFASFNLGINSGDDQTAVQANREQLMKDLKLPAEPKWIKQVHGANAVCAEQISDRPEADASYTKISNVVCLVLTADCMPLLICNRQGTCVAAIHAGWRGLSSGVIESTLKKLEIPAQDTLVWLGPAIGPKAFEVGDEVRQQFLQFDKNAEKGFTSLPNNKWLANLYLLAKQHLNLLDVTQIYGGDFCTYTDAKHFFSYRRDKGKTGRMASLIWINQK